MLRRLLLVLAALSLASGVLTAPDATARTSLVEVSSDNNTVRVARGDVTVVVDRDPWRLRVLRAGQPVVEEAMPLPDDPMPNPDRALYDDILDPEVMAPIDRAYPGLATVTYRPIAFLRGDTWTGVRPDNLDATYWPNRGLSLHVDFTNPGAEAWWRSELSTLIARGVDGVKVDRGEEDLSDGSVWAEPARSSPPASPCRTCRSDFEVEVALANRTTFAAGSADPSFGTGRLAWVSATRSADR